MTPADIGSLLAPYLGEETLTEAQLHQVSAYLDLLLKWNARINLTSVRRPEEIITRHFGESFFAARHLGLGATGEPSSRVAAPLVGRDHARSPDSSGRGTKERGASGAVDLIDLGSGAGFPGLPIKIYASSLSVTLIESNQKKATFLREVVRWLTLTNIDVFAGRAQAFPGAARIVTLRAVERHQQALAAAARLLAPGGRLALLLSSAQATSSPSVLPGFTWEDPVYLPGSSPIVLLLGRSSTV